MAISVPKSQADALGFDLAAAVSAFQAARIAHAATENEPAPTAHPLVEEIVQDGGAFEIFDDTPTPTPAELRRDLIVLTQKALLQRIDGICSPGRRQLAQLDLAVIGPKPLLLANEEPRAGVIYRTEAEQERFLEIQALFDLITVLQRHAVLLQIEIEDLPDGELAGWLPHSWP